MVKPCYVKCCVRNCAGNRAFSEDRLLQRGGKEHCPHCNSTNIAYVSDNYLDEARKINDERVSGRFGS